MVSPKKVSMDVLNEEMVETKCSRETINVEMLSNSKVLCLFYIVGCVFVVSVLAVPLFTPFRNILGCIEDKDNWIYMQDTSCPFIDTLGMKLSLPSRLLLGFDIAFKSKDDNISTCILDVTSSWNILHTTTCYTHNYTQCFSCLDTKDTNFILPGQSDIYIYVRCDNTYLWPFRLKNKGGVLRFNP